METLFLDILMQISAFKSFSFVHLKKQEFKKNDRIFYLYMTCHHIISIKCNENSILNK